MKCSQRIYIYTYMYKVEEVEALGWVCRPKKGMQNLGFGPLMWPEYLPLMFKFLCKLQCECASLKKVQM